MNLSRSKEVASESPGRAVELGQQEAAANAIPFPRAGEAISLVQKTARAKDEAESQEYNDDFARSAHKKRTSSLFPPFSEVGAEAHVGKRQKKSPTREIGKARELGLGKDARSCKR